MRHKAVIGLALVFALCVVSQSARAAPVTYDYFGRIAQVKVLDSSVPLPYNFVDRETNSAFTGTLAVDLALPPAQRLLRFSAFEAPGGMIEAAVGHPDNKVDSQKTSELGIGVPPPHWEMVTVKGNTGPLADEGGRSIGMSLQWYGEPGAARQYPADAQQVDLSTLTPRTTWRLTLTLRQGSVVYAVLLANVTGVRRRGSGGPDYAENFNDGLAQRWAPQNGAWSAATGDLRNSANALFTSNTVQGLTLPDNFVMLADVYLSWSASGNTAGILFNYLDPGNFYELRLNAQGVASFSQVRGGVRQFFFSNTYRNAGAKRWHTIYLKRDGIRGSALQIKINDRLVIDTEFDLDYDALRGGSAGVFASWNLARFDNVVIGAPPTSVAGGIKEYFEDPSRVPFPVQQGIWTVANGYLRSSTNQKASTAVANTGTGLYYGMTGLVYLEWSGSGNMGGFVYEYVDANNYREVRVSRTVADRPGEIVLAEKVRGVSREVLRRPRFQSSTDRTVLLTLRRENDRTIVNDGGAFTNIQIRQAPIAAPRNVGLLARWNMVRFDDVTVDHGQTE